MRLHILILTRHAILHVQPFVSSSDQHADISRGISHLAALGARQQKACGATCAVPLCYHMMHAMAGWRTSHAMIIYSVKVASSGSDTESVLADIVHWDELNDLHVAEEDSRAPPFWAAL